jgi:hypothetical protein
MAKDRARDSKRVPTLPPSLNNLSQGSAGSGWKPREVPTNVMDIAGIGSVKEKFSPNVTLVRRDKKSAFGYMPNEQFNKMSSELTEATKEGTVAKYNAAAREISNEGKPKPVIDIDSAKRK